MDRRARGGPFFYLLIIWLPPRRSRPGVSGTPARLFREQADIYIPASSGAFLLTAGVVLAIALRRRGEQPEGPMAAAPAD